MSNAFNLSQLANNVNSSGQISASSAVTGTLPVANGGTGRATNTAYAVICGGTTNGGVEQSIASVGTAGQVLTSNGAGALPTFQAAGGGSSFPAGTRMSFQQTSAPTGWTKDTTAAINDSIIRLVTSTASSGGSTAFSTWSAVSTVGSTTLSTSQIPSHDHSGGMTSPGDIYRGESYADGAYAPTNTGSTGGGGSHNHSITRNLKYYDFIIASKD